jgi:hypothetical protein
LPRAAGRSRPCETTRRLSRLALPWFRLLPQRAEAGRARREVGPVDGVGRDAEGVPLALLLLVLLQLPAAAAAAAAASYIPSLIHDRSPSAPCRQHTEVLAALAGPDTMAELGGGLLHPIPCPRTRAVPSPAPPLVEWPPSAIRESAFSTSDSAMLWASVLAESPSPIRWQEAGQTRRGGQQRRQGGGCGCVCVGGVTHLGGTRAMV